MISIPPLSLIIPPVVAERGVIAEASVVVIAGIVIADSFFLQAITVKSIIIPATFTFDNFIVSSFKMVSNLSSLMVSLDFI
jgi:hypothetical protein